jgi:hypothetical protein
VESNVTTERGGAKKRGRRLRREGEVKVEMEEG